MRDVRGLRRVRAWLQAWVIVASTLLALLSAGPVRAQGVELPVLKLNRIDGVLALEFAVSASLPKPVLEALQRGVPIYFVAEAQLLRSRWYWRDERVARVQRSWRLVFQPLTNSWRVSLGGLSQSFPTLDEAMAAVTRIGAWRVADLAQIDPDSRSHYLEFAWRLDTSQLPSPMQIGLPGSSGWAVGIERTLKLE